MSTMQVYPNRFERAKHLGRLGYSVSENRYCRGLYEVRKPDGTVYHVDATERSCDCPARVRDCAHLLFVERCIRFAAALERRQAMLRGRRARRHTFSRRHIERMREGVPTVPAPSLPNVCPVCDLASIHTGGPSCFAEDCPNKLSIRPSALTREEEVAASLYGPSRLSAPEPAAPWRPSAEERAWLREEARRGSSIDNDFPN